MRALCQKGKSFKLNWRYLSFLCERGVFFLLVGAVKILRLNQRNLQNSRQNPAQFSKNDHRGKMKISERKEEVARLNPNGYWAEASPNRLYPECCFTSLRIQS